MSLLDAGLVACHTSAILSYCCKAVSLFWGSIAGSQTFVHSSDLMCTVGSEDPV